MARRLVQHDFGLVRSGDARRSFQGQVRGHDPYPPSRSSTQGVASDCGNLRVNIAGPPASGENQKSGTSPSHVRCPTPKASRTPASKYRPARKQRSRLNLRSGRKPQNSVRFRTNLFVDLRYAPHRCLPPPVTDAVRGQMGRCAFTPDRGCCSTKDRCHTPNGIKSSRRREECSGTPANWSARSRALGGISAPRRAPDRGGGVAGAHPINSTAVAEFRVRSEFFDGRRSAPSTSRRALRVTTLTISGEWEPQSLVKRLLVNHAGPVRTSGG